MNTDELLDLLAIAEPDRAGCRALLGEGAGSSALDPAALDPALLDHAALDDALLGQVLDALVRSLGTFDEVPLVEPTQNGLVWLRAYLRLAPTLVEWHRARGIPEQITRDTLADVGRHVAISRRVTGGFGLQTWRWLSHHFTARIFALGRLQFALQRSPIAVPGLLAEGDWALGVHIPEAGPLRPELVDASLEQAVRFFADRFPDKPVSVVTCDSWMLDPHLLERMPATTNVGAFIRRFTPLDHAKDAPDEALYFVFRTRDLDLVPQLPRKTALQRAVLERAESGHPWQLAWGYLALPAPA